MLEIPMARKSPYWPFTPDPAQMALWPDISGNEINGLGQDQLRPPRMIYWAPEPDTIAHGGLQKWFYSVDPGIPDFALERKKRQEILAIPLPEPATDAVERAPRDWTALLDSFVQRGLCEKIGVATMQEDWVNEGHEISHSRVVVAGVQHIYDEISKAPAPHAGAEVIRQYNRAALVAIHIASWLREQGWDARPVTGPLTGDLALIPPALASGFGELGKHGSIIDRDMGASFRLSAVLTDAPFASTPKAEHGIDEFCKHCRICEDACPPEAISPDKKMVRGTEKWYVDFDRCLPFFNENQGCAICIAACPWSMPGVGPSLAEKLARRAKRLQSDINIT
jgi:epoxyqueuosine reductase